MKDCLILTIFGETKIIYIFWIYFHSIKHSHFLILAEAIGDGCELLKEKFPRAKITGIDISEIGIEKDICLKYVVESIIISTPYNQGNFSGRIRKVSEHRYSFNEKPFANYNCRVVKITEFVKATRNICIIYEIRP